MTIKEKFKEVKACASNPLWEQFIHRENEIYSRPDDIRSDFARDYTRILHSNGYRRLKTKTQVFFATKNDHICTRIEHINHVASISGTIAKYLGLNEELVSAIAIGHDIGHAPFGHHGEGVIKNIIKKQIPGSNFWHEKNSLFFLDNIETLSDSKGFASNMNLTYAVRDGIISHCGEVNDAVIVPREENLDLSTIEKASKYQPFTWEGCVVKISDKIAYLGRDIEDAAFFKILTPSNYRQLALIVNRYLPKSGISEITNGALIHGFIIDLVKNSSPETGIQLSQEYLGLMNEIKEFNYKIIYQHWRIESFKKYATVVIEEIFNTLMRFYNFYHEKLSRENRKSAIDQTSLDFPTLSRYFGDWLVKYSNIDLQEKAKLKYKNIEIYNVNCRESYVKCCLDFISGMTDNFAIKVYDEIVSF